MKDIGAVTRMRFAVCACFALVVAGGYAVGYASRQMHTLVWRESPSQESVTFTFEANVTRFPPSKPAPGSLVLVKGKALREVEILDPAGRRIHRFPLSTTCNPVYPTYCQWQLAPGGSAFLAELAGDGGPTGVQIVDMSAGEERVLTFHGTYYGVKFDWLDDQTLFLSPSNLGPAWTVDARGRRVIPLRLDSPAEGVSPPDDMYVRFTDSLPGGRRVLLSVFLSGTETKWWGRIGVWDRRSGDIELVVPSGERDCENAFSISAKASFLMECHRGLGGRVVRTNLYEVSSMAVPRQVLTLPGHERLVAVSPDGRRLVLESEGQSSYGTSTLRILDLENGSWRTVKVRVTWTGLGAVEFAPDGEALYVVESGAGGRLWRLDLASGRKTTVAEDVYWAAVVR